MAVGTSDGQFFADADEHFLASRGIKIPVTGGKSEPPKQDYDYEGAIAAGFTPDSREHWPDRFKLPNHITFSSESKYATPGAGKWEKTEDDKWQFTPGPDNLKHHSRKELEDHFKENEKGSILKWPEKMANLGDSPLDRPLGPPDRVLRPPMLPGAKGEYLTSGLMPIAPRIMAPEGYLPPTSADHLRQGVEEYDQMIPGWRPERKDDPVEDPDLNEGKEASIPIIRHGETKENEEDIAHGWSNEPLVKRGREQVEKTAGELKSNPPTLIAHSDLKRAAESAKIIAKETGAKTLPIPELRTWDIGDFAGKKCGECEKELKQYVDNPDKRVPGGESFNDFRRRVQEGWGKAMAAGADALVTHNKTERLIDAMEKSETPHEVFDHKGGPGPGEMRRIQLAGDVIPGPSTWRRLPDLGVRGFSRGRESISRMYDRGEGGRLDDSKVRYLYPEEVARQKRIKELDKLIQEGESFRKTPYEEALTKQQEGMSRKNPMLRLVNPEDEPEPKL